MKKTHILLLLLISVIPLLAQKKINPAMLDLINGKYYQRNTVAPFTGTAQEEYSNGRKKSVMPIKDGLVEGKVKKWGPAGTLVLEATYVAGKLHGTETQYYNTGTKKAEVTFVQDLPDGMATEWYKNGQKKSEGRYRSGLEEGEHIWWYEDGKTDQMVPYIAGKTHGTVKSWYPNGQLRMESNFEHGRQHGFVRKWHSNGQKTEECEYVSGHPTGKCKTWRKDGYLAEVKTHDANGNIVRVENYRSGGMRVQHGYIEVLNGTNFHCKIPIRGKEVIPQPESIITYAVDNVLLQVHTLPRKKFENIAASDDKKTLNAFLKYETEYIEKNTQSEIQPITQWGSTEEGRTYMYWHFTPPANGENNGIIQEEHYLSIVCGSRIVSLYSTVTDLDNPKKVRTMLENIGKRMVVSDVPIDLNRVE